MNTTLDSVIQETLKNFPGITLVRSYLCPQCILKEVKDKVSSLPASVTQDSFNFPPIETQDPVMCSGGHWIDFAAATTGFTPEISNFTKLLLT